MDKLEIVDRWIASTEDAIVELVNWRAAPVSWKQCGGEVEPGDFSAAFDRLCKSGLGDTCRNPCGLDALAAAVTREKV
jgi:hypothetical protein